MPMKAANLLDTMRATCDGQIHFFYVAEMAISVTMAENSTNVTAQFKEAEHHDSHRLPQRQSQVSRVVGSDSNMMWDLPKAVAAVRIQSQFHKTRAARETKDVHGHDNVFPPVPLAG